MRPSGKTCQTWRRGLRAALDFLLPPDIACVCCGSERAVLPDYSVCADCAARLQRLQNVALSRCGDPDAGFAQAWAALAFAGAGRELIHRFKYDGQTYLARNLAYFLRDALADSGWRGDALVPVPLHPKRCRERGYNQAALLARELSRLTGVPCWQALARTRNTPRQVGLSAAQRAQNVRDAFALAPGRDVRGVSLLLVDDVLTTGATARACARVCMEKGARAVCVLTVAAARGGAKQSVDAAAMESAQEVLDTKGGIYNDG